MSAPAVALIPLITPILGKGRSHERSSTRGHRFCGAHRGGPGGRLRLHQHGDRRAQARRRARAARPTAAAVQTGNPASGRPCPRPGRACSTRTCRSWPRASTPPTPTSPSPPPRAARARASLRPSAAPSTMGGSDAYLSPAQVTANPGILNIPIAVSAQAVNYNLAGITNLKLSGNVLAQIYSGTITTWNDPAIAALNPGVTLPGHPDHPGPARPTPRVTPSSSPPSSAPPTPPGPAARASGPRSTGRRVTSELTATRQPGDGRHLPQPPRAASPTSGSASSRRPWSTASVRPSWRTPSGSFVQPNQTDHQRRGDRRRHQRAGQPRRSR